MAMLTLLRRAAQRSTRAVSSSTASFSASPITASTRTRHVAVASASIPQARAVSVDSLFSAPSRVIVTPAYHANDVTGVLAGVAVVSALIGVGKMWWDASSSSPSAAPTRVKDISREEIAQFFMDLKASIAQLFAQLPELDEQFRQHLKSQNVELSEEEYKQTLLQQLLSILQNIEQQVVGARGWDREAFQHALERFADDEEIANLQKELQVIMHSVFPPPEIPSHLTPEKALEILAILTKGMEQAMTEMLKHARAEGITDPAKAMEEFQQIYLDQIEQVTFETMKKHEVSGDIFNVALQKYYGEDPAFRKKVEAIYAEQAAVFRRMGLDVDTN